MFTGYLPPRFLMSEVLKTNTLPLWNPYIAFGIPFYGDMSGAYWSPVTWLIASTSGYNAYTLTIEVMIYIVTGAIGMYILSSQYTTKKYICFIAAVAYIGNGYMVGHLQHLNWLSGAAFLPWCLWSINRMFKSSSLQTILIAVLSFYFFIASAHPGIVIGALYFFIPYIVFKLFNRTHISPGTSIIIPIKTLFTFLLLLLLLAAGLIIGYADIYSEFGRKEKLGLELVLAENTTIQSWISILLPFSTTKNPELFNNDIALRNSYCGLLILSFFISGFLKKMKREQIFFLCSSLFFFILSTGGVFKLFAYKFLPLLGYVRVNGEFRIFTIIGLIIIAVMVIDEFNPADSKQLKKMSLVIKGLIILLAFSFIAGIYIFLNDGKENSLFQTTHSFFSNIRPNLKSLVDQISFAETLLIQSVLQISLLALLLFFLKKNKTRQILFIVCIDIILATLMNLPYTGVGKEPVKKINAILQKSPDGIPVPDLKPVNDAATIPPDEEKLIGDWSFYNKQPGPIHDVYYPIKLNSVVTYYQLQKKDSNYNVNRHPLLFITDSSIKYPLTQILKIKKDDLTYYSVNQLHLEFTSPQNGNLVFLQNSYKYWLVKNENETSHPSKLVTGFMYIPVKQGNNKLTFEFKPAHIPFLLLSTLVLLCIYIFLCFTAKAKNNLFN